MATKTNKGKVRRGAKGVRSSEANATVTPLIKLAEAKRRRRPAFIESASEMRELLLDEVFRVLRRVPSSELIAWLPVFCEYRVDVVDDVGDGRDAG